MHFPICIALTFSVPKILGADRFSFEVAATEKHHRCLSVIFVQYVTQLTNVILPDIFYLVIPKNTSSKFYVL